MFLYQRLLEEIFFFRVDIEKMSLVFCFSSSINSKYYQVKPDSA